MERTIIQFIHNNKIYHTEHGDLELFIIDAIKEDISYHDNIDIEDIEVKITKIYNPNLSIYEIDCFGNLIKYDTYKPITSLSIEDVDTFIDNLNKDTLINLITFN